MSVRSGTKRARLSPYACIVTEVPGHPVSTCDLRTTKRDRDRIIHCKSFRRLKYKTQVFLTPMGDHYRTRLTHTLEVSQVARTLARSLRLNEDLTEAAALGHDLGHTPFGHIGESTLNRLLPGGFRHNEQSLRVAERLENDGQGLNLCRETLDGILNHSGQNEPKTLEGWCVRRADRIAYINHDIERRHPRRHSQALRAAAPVPPADAGRDAWRTHRHHDPRHRDHLDGSALRQDVRGGAAGQRRAARALFEYVYR